MTRPGPRPHTWKVQGEIPHKQHRAWLRAKAQAAFRDEPWTLTFEQWQAAWQQHWHLRGRTAEDYCITRRDPTQAWSEDNVETITRLEHIRRSKSWLQRKGKRNKLQVSV